MHNTLQILKSKLIFKILMVMDFAIVKSDSKKQKDKNQIFQ